MSEPTVIPPGGGEIVGDTPERRVEILSDHDALHATRSRYGPGRDGADLHVHHGHTDLFYVLEGELTLRLGVEDERVGIPAGMLARMPPLVVHGFRNSTESEVRYLNFHAPGRDFANFLRALRDGRTLAYDQHPPPQDGGRPATEAVIGRGTFTTERPGLRTALLADVAEIRITETWCDPGLTHSAPRRHRHLASFYVLAGEMALGAGDRELRATAGSWAQVPARLEHTVSFPGPKPARVLEIHTPCVDRETAR